MPQQVIKKFHPSPLAFWLNYFIGFVIVALFVKFGMIALGVGIIILGVTEIVRQAETYYIYDNGVSRDFSLITTHRTFASYENIEDLTVSQNIIERILGIGTIKVNTAGSHLVEVNFRGVKNLHEVEGVIREHMTSRRVSPS